MNHPACKPQTCKPQNNNIDVLIRGLLKCDFSPREFNPRNFLCWLLIHSQPASHEKQIADKYLLCCRKKIQMKWWKRINQKVVKVTKHKTILNLKTTFDFNTFSIIIFSFNYEWNWGDCGSSIIWYNMNKTIKWVNFFRLALFLIDIFILTKKEIIFKCMVF